MLGERLPGRRGILGRIISWAGGKEHEPQKEVERAILEDTWQQRLSLQCVAVRWWHVKASQSGWPATDLSQCVVTCSIW
jgi:hypothetical protein